jgi:hypothetical protein
MPSLLRVAITLSPDLRMRPPARSRSLTCPEAWRGVKVPELMDDCQISRDLAQTSGGSETVKRIVVWMVVLVPLTKIPLALRPVRLVPVPCCVPTRYALPLPNFLQTPQSPTLTRDRSHSPAGPNLHPQSP